MEWDDKLQGIIDYVEEHLQRKEQPISETTIAEIAGCSYGFFQKVFSYMNGISFSEYVRSRKLTLAGYDLKSTNMKVVDISFKYGYDSPTSFTKAFQQFHNLTPKDARHHHAVLRVVPKMQIAQKQTFSWRLEHKSSFRILAKSKKLPFQNNEQYSEIPKFWSDCRRDGVYANLISLDTALVEGIFGLFMNHDESRNEVEYVLAVESNKAIPHEYHEIIIPEATWAIFDCKGSVPDSIQKGWKFLYEEWIINYPFQHAPCPELEWYSAGNEYSDDYLSQIWIPIIEEK